MKLIFFLPSYANNIASHVGKRKLNTKLIKQVAWKLFIRSLKRKCEQRNRLDSNFHMERSIDFNSISLIDRIKWKSSVKDAC